ncbi:hypothetical protein [Pygmaiobacter massiliensis]|uniref:hypothetical protein n=1 Tax=Pygmaiobacter massiliensis TaxID=1917873 RepID=UPI002A7EEFCB|nr:hypothetical protein [Pygmaiobacter massiliensis]MDY4784673.1 hypothetical protein [Pygmaiobacter massiliensis]
MNQGMIRNLKYQGRIMGEMLLYTLLTAAAMLVWQALTTPLSYLAANLAVNSVLFLVFAAFIWSAGCFLAMHTSYMPYMLAMGTTRKASFAVCQLSKLGYALGIIVIGLIANGFIGALSSEEKLPFTGSIILLVFCATIFFCSMMEVVGIMAKRFGKWGMIAYVIICMIMGGVVGGTVAMSGTGTLADIAQHLIHWSSGNGLLFAACGLLLLLSALSTLLCWRIYRKIEV